MLATMLAAFSATFERFSATHGAAVLACVAGSVLLVTAGRRLARGGDGAEMPLRLAWAGLVLFCQAASQVVQNVPAHVEPRITLPLHVCDLVGLLAPFALLSRRRLPRSLLVFWGLGLGSFALILPIVREGPASIWFWLFWFGHFQIFASSLWVLAVDGFVPGPRDAGIAFAATCAYFAFVTPFNLLLGADYGVIGPGASATAMLGPWPVRVPVLLLLQGLLFVLMIPAIRATRRALGGRERAPSAP